MSEVVWLVRHASTAWTGRRWCGRTDLPLSPAGREEAERLAGRLAEALPRDAEVVSSPAQRARATAAPIGRSLNVGYRIVETLREVDFGRAEGHGWPELERDLPDLARDIAAGRSSIDWPAGDSATVTEARALGIWLDVEQATASDLVLVTHGGTIRCLLSAAGVEGPVEMVPPASATPLRRIDGHWSMARPRVTA